MRPLQISDFVQDKKHPGLLLGQIVDLEPDGKWRILALGKPNEVYINNIGVRTVVVQLVESYQYYHEATEDIERWESE